MVAVLAHAKPATFLSSLRRAEVGGRFRPKTQRGWAFGRSGPEVGPHINPIFRKHDLTHPSAPRRITEGARAGRALFAYVARVGQSPAPPKDSALL
jgi:hypothetical protein